MFMAITGSSANMHRRKGHEDVKGKGKKKGKKAKDTSDVVTEIVKPPKHRDSKVRPQSSPIKGRRISQHNSSETSASMNKLPPIQISPSKAVVVASSSSIPENSAIPPVLSVLQQAQQLLALPPKHDDSCGKVTIRFNHYHKEFPIHNGVLKWADVDHDYALSFVYQGNYKRDMELIPASALAEGSFNIRAFIARQFNYHQTEREVPHVPVYAPHDDEHTYFIHMKHHQQYVLHVEEHPEAGIAKNELRVHLKPLKADELSSTIATKPNQAFQDITHELRTMDPNQLNSSQAKDLLERRDLEDILYSTS